MGASKGNQFAKGNRGGGRLTSAEELKRRTLAQRLFEEPVDAKKLERKIKAGRASMNDVMLYKVLMGSDRLLLRIFKMRFPRTNYSKYLIKKPSFQRIVTSLKAEIS